MYRHTLVLSLLGLLAWATWSGAQSGPVNKDAPPPPAPPPAGMTPLDDTNLPKMLNDLGFKKVDGKKNQQNEAYWVIQTERNGWGFVVEVVPERNKTTKQITGFWLISDLGGTLNNPAALSGPALLKLMEKSHTMAPYFFTFNPATKHIALNYEYPFSSIDKKGLQNLFDTLFTRIRDTYDLWKSDVLTANGKVDPNPMPGKGLAGATFAGSENLGGYGNLSFEFQQGGKAVMVDKDGKSPGTWTQTGDQITLKFYDGQVTYKGTLKGETLSGTGSNAQTSWTFTLKRK